MSLFRTREEAGSQLGERLSYLQDESAIVMTIPRGGVPVGAAVSKRLKAPLGVIPMRPLAVSWLNNTIIGYVAGEERLCLNQPLIGQLRVTRTEIHQMAKKERSTLAKQVAAWGVPVLSSLGKRTVILADDGMHSGWTMFSAVETVRGLGASRIVVAVPVTHFRARRFVSPHCDEFLALRVEEVALYQIRNYYERFPDISDEQIKDLLGPFQDGSSQSAA